MTRNEFNTLFKQIQSEFDDFKGDYDEWYKILCNYSYEDVLKNFKKYTGVTPPIYLTLIKNLKQEEKIDDWLTKCDICGKEIRIYNNDMSEYDKHYRKCQKIDFINRMSQKYKGVPAAIVKYYEMSDDELDRAYRKIMDFYVQHREKPELFKKIPNEE
jgi:hypothetical protein